jgi:hypothetical protein
VKIFVPLGVLSSPLIAPVWGLSRAFPRLGAALSTISFPDQFSATKKLLRKAV